MNDLTQNLEGAAALVTGGAQGIGLEVVRLLASSGARVAVCDLPDERPASLEDIEGVEYLRGDVTKSADVDRAVAAAVERLGGLQILINNAGIAIDNLVMRLKDAQWEKTLQVNLTGAFYCCRAAARHLLRARGAGRVVNIASVVGEQGNAGQAAYAASKAGLIGLTRTLAREFASRGTTVNAVAPGFIETRMTDKHIQGDRREQLISLIPLGRIGSSQDVAEAVRFLCLPAAGYITGQVLRVNGGMYM